MASLVGRRTQMKRLRERNNHRLSTTAINPFTLHEQAYGKPGVVPDIMEWITSDAYLDRPNLYPRQATILKTIFLQDHLFTEFDLDVLGEWEEQFRQTGVEGCSPGLLDRIATCKAQGRSWFREVLGIIGRRGSKGYMGGLAGSYVLWNYMHRPGGPQTYYGIDRDKRLTAIVFAGKKEQARDNQWRDLYNVITGGPCFTPYISTMLGESLTVYAPTDVLRAQRHELLGIQSASDIATFEIVPSPSTLMAGRGPTSFCLDPSTPVLKSDLTWAPIEDLNPGDHVVGVDEYPDSIGKQRKMRDAVVQAVSRTRKPARRLTFEDGSSVVCSHDHRWLVRDMGKGGATHWRTAGRMVPGNHIKHMVDPWAEEKTWEAGYLAGLYDGEGCVSGWSGRGGKSVFFSQNPGPVLDTVLGLLDDRGISPVRSNTGVPEGSTEQWSLSGLEAMAFLGRVRPSRLMTKAKSVWEGVAPRGGATARRERPNSYKTIVSIEELPEHDLVDIQTSTKTFVAAGLVSHNCQFYDEFAHVVASGQNRDADAVWNAATPSLDQFGVDAFIYQPSSPWQKTGQFFANAQKAIEVDADGSPAFPEMVMFQLPSWGPYEDWEEADRIPLRPPKKTYIEVSVDVPKTVTDDYGDDLDIVHVDVQQIMRLIPGETFKPLKRAIQTYDEQMKQLERANPESFAVERRSRWAQSLLQYLNTQKVAAVFEPWEGEPETHIVSRAGALDKTYLAHGDPATSNKRFGWSMGHMVRTSEDPAVIPHVVIDVIRCWEPGDYEDHMLDYDDVMGDIETDVRSFMPDSVSFDQFNVPATIGRLRKYVARAGLPKSTQVHEVVRTRPLNWKHYELFKSAINMGLVHAPMFKPDGEVNYASSEGELELRFLEEKNGAVDHPSTGPVQTKDIADTICEVVVGLIGAQVATFLGQDLAELGLVGSVQSSTDPMRHQQGPINDVADRLASLTSGAARGVRRTNRPGGPRGMTRR